MVLYMENITAAYILDAHTYVKRGAFATTDPQEWSDTFKAVGGAQCLIQPAWAFGEPVGGVYMTVVGTPEAVAFVDATL